MRRWRKVWKNISISDKIANLGYETRWLYLLLLLYQDDAGNCQYSRSKMKSMVAGSTEWTNQDIQRFLTELETNELVTVVNGENNIGYIYIHGGMEKNGNLYNDREPLVYDMDFTVGGNKEKHVSLKNLKTKNLKTKELNQEENRYEKNRSTKTNTKSRFQDDG